MALTQQQPSCFGKMWDPNTTECSGGPDAAYRDINGSHIRERCGFFEQCGATKQASAMASQIIPTTNLLHFQRPVTPAPSPVINPQPFGGQPTQIQPTVAAAQQQQVINQLLQQVALLQRNNTIQQAVVPQQAMPMMHGYQQMMPVNFAVPQYLTIREDRESCGGIWGMLGREVVRSMGKSFGHTLSNFFDSTPFYGPK